MRILTAEEMAAVDRRAIEEIGVPSLVLMENAAIGIADAIGERYPDVESVAIFCGPGNNGGDGLALARHLECRGYEQRVFWLGGDRPARGDVGAQMEILRRLEIAVEVVASDEQAEAALVTAATADLLVDALFGTGLSRPLAGRFARLVDGLNRIRLPRVAVDLPSGLFGGTASVPGPSLQADLTVTFAAPKVAHVLPPAADLAGELVVSDLGVPPRLVDEAPGDLHLLVGAELAGLLGPREAAAHKGDFGHLLLVGGSPGKAGAVILAARAAIRAGAGLVTAAVPEGLVATVDGGSIESMTLPLPATPAGHLAGSAVERILEAAEGKDAVAIGPGLGTAVETQEAIREAVRRLPLPLVVDADGLNAFAGGLEALAERRAPIVLTPHPGEIGRLLGLTTAEVQRDRLTAVRQAVATGAAVVALKGFLTLVGVPGEGVHVNPTGNPGMATGGTGDVLTGLVGALAARGLDAGGAARLGVFLHGLAGDLAAARVGQESLRAADLIAAMPEAFAELERR